MVCGAACGASNGPDIVDSGSERDDALADAANGQGDVKSPPANVVPELVFVDGVAVGSATWPQGGFNLDDVRVCVHDQAAAPNVFITPQAVPSDRVIPLTNYVGLQKGSGIDLGSFNAAAIDIDVYPAILLQNDAAWSPDPNETCAKISCTKQGPPCVAHVRLSVVLTGSVNVVALVDDQDLDSGLGVKSRSAAFIDTTFDGTIGAINGTVVDLSDWHTGETIAAYYGDPQGTSGSGAELAKPLAKDAAGAPIPITKSIASYETFGVRFDQIGSASDTFGQSLDSIAYVANPTVTPPDFYGVRENFVFALVGDPNDATSVNLENGRNPSFNRNGLHIAAIPYATPRPK